MHVLKRRILHYVKLNNALPTSINQLPVLEGLVNSTIDGWGWEMHMQIHDTEVILTSYGKDNKPGGVGADLDLVAVFDAKLSTGAWADENDDGSPSWKTLPKIRWDKSEYGRENS